MVNKWDQRFLELAETVASWSKDPRTKVGCVLVNPETHQVLGQGYNGFPRGVPDDPAWLADRDIKLAVVLHAEVNAVLNATGSLKGSVAYVNLRPCCRCAAVLLQVGVSRIVYEDKHPGDYKGDVEETFQSMCLCVGVEVVAV